MTVASRKVASGFGWIALISYANRLFGLIATLILAKVLTPSDFGVVAVASMLIEVLRLLKDMGFSEALIYQKRDDPVAIDTANTIIVGFNSILFVIAVAVSPFVARFYDSWLVMPVIIVMSSNLIWDSLRAVPRALIRKNMDFHKLVIPEVVPVMASSAVSIVMALTGFGVWSLVAKTVIHSVLGAVLLIPSAAVRLRFRLDRGAARELFGYGRFVAGTTVLLVVLYNIDRFYVSRIEGVVALGVFELAMRISDLPVKEFSFVVGSVMFPVFAKVERSGGSLGQALLKTLKYTSFVSLPMAIGISVYGPPLVTKIYGSKWDGIVIPLQILALYAMFRSLSSILYDGLKASGNPHLMQRFVIFKLGCIGVLGIPVLIQFGLNGLCALILSTYAISFFAEMWLVTKRLGLNYLPSLSVLAVPLFLSLIVVPGTSVALGMHWRPAPMWQHGGAILLTCVTSLAAIWLVDKEAVSDVRAVTSRVAA